MPCPWHAPLSALSCVSWWRMRFRMRIRFRLRLLLRIRMRLRLRSRVRKRVDGTLLLKPRIMIHH